MSEREDDRGGDEICIKIDGDSKKTNGWKSLKEMKEYLRSEFEKKVKLWERNGGETHLHFAAFLGDADATKMLIEGNAEVDAGDKRKQTALHWAAEEGHVEVAKVLIQNGADVNAVDCTESTALHFASKHGYNTCTLQLLCFGAEIDEEAIKDDKTELLGPIENILTLLGNGNRMGTSLMSDEERRLMWNLEFVLAVKHPAIAFGTYQRIRSFVTFQGIFMGPGYDLGEGSIWRKEVDGDW